MDDRPYQMPPRKSIPEGRYPWPAGPWDDEPDFEAWTEPETGYACCAMRNPLGHWCGYVRVPDEHLLVDVDSKDRVTIPPGWTNKQMTLDDVGVMNAFIEMFEPSDDRRPLAMLVAVHGGLSYSEGPWFGFDCGHAGDESPGILAVCRAEYRELSKKYGYQYRDLSYVRHECNQLAWQLKELGEAMAAVADRQLTGAPDEKI